MQLVRHARKEGTLPQQLQSVSTGQVYAEVVFTAQDQAPCVCANVTFLPGARTHWHTHEKGQILVVISGEGLICSENEEPRFLRAGDVVHIPGGEKHWHGATQGALMTHMAIAFGGCEWHEPVMGDTYERAMQRAT